MKILILFLTFFKIGFFSFGGGYAMIGLMQGEILSHGWISAREYADIVAISQMTPGPIAVNAATYIGFKTAGFWGSFFATIGVFLPSFILVVVIAHLFRQFRENRFVSAAMKGIQPATVGLIASAVVFFSEMSIFTGELPIRHLFTPSAQASVFGVSPEGMLIFGIILLSVKRFKLGPIAAIALSGLLGILLIP